MATKNIKFLSDPNGPGVLSTKYADISTIEFLPDNIKAHDLEGIRASIAEYGFTDPIVINRTTRRVIGGNGRLECLLIMLSDGSECPKGIIERPGRETRPKSEQDGRIWYAPIVDGLEFDETDELTLSIIMNRLPERGGIDNAKAYAVLARLREQDPESLIRVGYDEQTLDHIRQLAKFQKQLEEHQNKPPAPAAETQTEPTAESRESFVQSLNTKWNVQVGDRWQIGRHLLKCCDSTDADAVAAGLPLKTDRIQVHRPRLVFTSPPYDQQRSYETGDQDWTRLMIGVSESVFAFLEDPADFVVNLGPVYQDSKYKEYWRGWLDYSDRVLDHPLYGFYIWDKMFGYPGNYHGRLARSHEFLFHFSIGHAQANKWIETTGEAIRRGPTGHDQRKKAGHVEKFGSPETVGQAFKIPDSVIRIHAEMTRGIHTQGHPATFPVALPEFAILTWTQIGDLVYEPFGGSGTTMLACQLTDRVCYATEISPNYCALILERMKQEFPELEIAKL